MAQFRMYGRIIELLRWKVTYNDETNEWTEYFKTEAEADECVKQTGGTKKAVEIPASDEWLDGLEVEDVPDTYGRALEIAEMGQEAYLEMVNTPTAEDYLIDLDYRVSKVELGL